MLNRKKECQFKLKKRSTGFPVPRKGREAGTLDKHAQGLELDPRKTKSGCCGGLCHTRPFRHSAGIKDAVQKARNVSVQYPSSIG